MLSEMLGAELRHRHARTLEALEAPGAPDVPGRLEHLLAHALGAGDRRRGFRYSRAAARRAGALGAHDEAQRHLERALALWQAEDGEAARADALLELGRARMALGDRAGAVRVLGEARGHAAAAGVPELSAVVRAAEAEARFDLYERDGVLEDLAAGRRALPPDASPEARREVLARIARVLVVAGRPTEAAQAAREALAIAAPGAGAWQARGTLHLRITLGGALVEQGEEGAGGRMLREALAWAAARDDGVAANRALLWLARLEWDRQAVAARRAGEAVDVAARHGLARAEGRARAIRAGILSEMGDWDAADADLEAGDRLLAGLGSDPALAMALDVARATNARRRGDLHGALERFAAVVADAEPREAWELSWTARVGLARARLAAGDPEGADEALRPALRRWGGRPEGLTGPLIIIALTAVEIAAAREDAEEARDLVGVVARHVPGPRAAYAQALAGLAAGEAPDPGAIEEAAAAVAAAGRRPEAARMRLIAAEGLARLGRTDAAARLASAALRGYRDLGAEEWARRCEGLLRRLGRRAPTRGAGGGAEGLTPRELEVLGLIAEGLSNRGIATRLVISESTAARHVFHVFAKLGVHTRAQATRVAVERGLVGGAPPG